MHRQRRCRAKSGTALKDDAAPGYLTIATFNRFFRGRKFCLLSQVSGGNGAGVIPFHVFSIQRFLEKGFIWRLT